MAKWTNNGRIDEASSFIFVQSVLSLDSPSFRLSSVKFKLQYSMAHSYFVGRPISAITTINTGGNGFLFATASGAPKVRLRSDIQKYDGR